MRVLYPQPGYRNRRVGDELVPVPVASGGIVASSVLLLESGDALLLESGDRLRLE